MNLKPKSQVKEEMVSHAKVFVNSVRMKMWSQVNIIFLLPSSSSPPSPLLEKMALETI